MKYMKRAGVYKASNVTFSPTTKDAISYEWWRFVAVVEGKLVFNDFRYSVSTAKHQRKVRDLLATLNLTPAITMPLPRGIRHDQTLSEMIVEAEEHLCNQLLEKQIKQQEAYQRSKQRKATAKLTNYLENVVSFRDYMIKSKELFGTINEIAVHQVVDADSLADDVDNALHNFSRDGFSKVVFYV